MTASLTTSPSVLGIADVAAASGLSPDTLRWYEKEGLIPPVRRDAAGRRAYSPADVRMVQMIVRLRRTGMPVADTRAFVRLVEEGATSHGRRITLLAQHRERILAKQRELAEDLAALDDKLEHYERLIARGLDCAQEPVRAPDARERQRSRDLDRSPSLT